MDLEAQLQNTSQGRLPVASTHQDAPSDSHPPSEPQRTVILPRKTAAVLASHLLVTRLRGPENDGQGVGEQIRIDGGMGRIGDLDEYVLCGGVETGEVAGISSGDARVRRLVRHIG